jgi:hypothetical protein
MSIEDRPKIVDERRTCACGLDTASARNNYVCYTCRNRPFWEAEDDPTAHKGRGASPLHIRAGQA